jgi:hypothetical protein
MNEVNYPLLYPLEFERKNNNTATAISIFLLHIPRFYCALVILSTMDFRQGPGSRERKGEPV